MRRSGQAGPFPKLKRVNFGAWEDEYGDGVFPAMCRVYCTDSFAVLLVWGVNDVCPGLPSWVGWRWSRRGDAAGEADGVCVLRGQAWTGIPGDRTPEGGLPHPPPRHGLFLILCNGGDVYRNWDFDCIGERQGIRS